MLETSFRIHRDEMTRTLIGCPPTAERPKIGFDPIAMEGQLRRNGSWKRQRHNGIFHVGNVILTALTEFLWNLCNGETATEWWKPGISRNLYRSHWLKVGQLSANQRHER